MLRTSRPPARSTESRRNPPAERTGSRRSSPPQAPETPPARIKGPATRSAHSAKEVAFAASESAAAAGDQGSARWTFLTNHAHVLIVLWEEPSLVLRQVAARIGITERAVQRIVADLEAEGFITREKVGRQNHYRIQPDRPLRHPIEAHRSVRDLLELVSEPGV